MKRTRPDYSRFTAALLEESRAISAGMRGLNPEKFDAAQRVVRENMKRIPRGEITPK